MSCLPMALISSAATTEESTPPERASSTFLSPQQYLLVADLRADGLDLLVDEGLRKLGGGDALHVVRALVREVHASSFERGIDALILS